jgi:GntR family transcriptional regulator
VKIDPGSHIPIYLQIADGLRAAVAAGVYRPGQALPSLRALAIDARVNPNTVQRAYDQFLTIRAAAPSA